MQEAGPMGLLRTIAIILIIYYVFKFLARLFAPYLMKRMVNKMQEKASQQYNSNHQHKSTVREGETVIDKAPQNMKEGNKNVGEYVDFEEID